MLKGKAFKGSNVFMSRNLVPPEIFDALHDVLKLNGAEIFLCCDPSRTGPDDFHIISSPDHEKFEDLRAKGCNLIGPQCIFSCAKEHRALPKQQFTCCLAMDGVKVLASGFEADEKGKIEKLVTAMGGVFHSKASSDVSFVIVNNVLAAKYKWAVHMLKKPVVTVNWLHQCWSEHRIVPQESFRVLPFSGLIICVTRIPADERKKIENIIIQNGGKYSAELTKKCTHLISDAPEGDKYKVARKWGHICIVTRKWFDQSVARRACLNEESYPVHGGSVLPTKRARGCMKMQNSQGQDISNWQSAASSMATDINLPACSSGGLVDPDTEATLSQSLPSTFSVDPVFVEERGNEEPVVQSKIEKNPVKLDDCVANDSQSEDSDLYLSECRILLIGFEASEMRRLVNMVRKGGGSRYVLFNDKLTHIVVGTPSEIEKKEVRNLAALGIIHVVRTNWLEDCDQEKKEIPVYQRHIARDLLLPKGALTGMTNEGRISAVHLNMPSNQIPGRVSTGIGMQSALGKDREDKPQVILKSVSSVETATRSFQQTQVPVRNVKNKVEISDKNKGSQKLQQDSSVRIGKSSSVFKGKIFSFSSSFPEDKKGEIVQWINQGGGLVVDDHLKQNVHFTIECHGLIPKNVGVLQTYVSSHWVRYCLESYLLVARFCPSDFCLLHPADNANGFKTLVLKCGCLLDVSSHILYSPLPCRVPLPGFESFLFCVSQYEEKDRMLLRNLCFVLGAKLVEKLTKKVTHLLCKFANGLKYEAACKWGMHTITAEWIYECVKQNKVVPLDLFCPKEVTTQDKEAGLCTMSQFPTQAVRMISVENPSQFPSQSEDTRTAPTEIVDSRNDSLREEAKGLSKFTKKARLFEDDSLKSLLSSGVHSSTPLCDTNSTRDNILQDGDLVPDVAAAIEDLLQQTPLCDANSTRDGIPQDGDQVSNGVPDVAAAIEDLLEQTSKIHEQKSPGRTMHDESLFSSNCSTITQDQVDTHSVVGLSKHWLNRTAKKDDIRNSSGDGNLGMYDGFSETQTDSQVVGYEEDLSGRQMLIDRVRTRSSML